VVAAGIISNASSPSDGDPMKVQRSRASLLQCLLAKLHALKLTTDKAGLLAITSPSQPVAPRPSWLFLQPNNSHPPHSPTGAGYRRFPEAHQTRTLWQFNVAYSATRRAAARQG